MFLLIRGARVYAPEDLGVCDILICSGRIVAVAPHIDFSFDGLTVLEAGGKIAVPGLMDQHVHITGGGGESSFRSRIREIDAADIIQSGVTTVVGLLGTDGISRSVENLVAKTKALNEEGITAFCLTGSYALPSVTLTGSVEKDIAFVQEVIGVKVAITDHRSSSPSAEELARLAAQVRVASLLSGKPGVVCMHTGVGKKALSDVIRIVETTDIPIQHFRPTHVGHLLPDAIRFANLGGYIDFTSGDRPADTARTIAQAAGQAPLERMTLSSDANGSAPIWNEKRELIGMGVGRMDTLWATVRALITEGLMSPPDALSLVTSNVARALELYPRKGCLAAGADADLTLLDGAWNVDSVIARGRVLLWDKDLRHRGYYRRGER